MRRMPRQCAGLRGERGLPRNCPGNPTPFMNAPPIRQRLHDEFVSRFGITGSESVIPPTRLVQIETHLGICLPNAYREFVSRHGAVRFDYRLAASVADQVHLWDIRSFLSESELLECERYYVGAGMRPSLLGFASDSLGNLFCFDRANLLSACDDAPVWFFDHEFNVDWQLSHSFDDWVQSYVLLRDPGSP